MFLHNKWVMLLPAVAGTALKARGSIPKRYALKKKHMDSEM
jgi:hypothetical protein